MAKQKKPVHRVEMTEGKRNIIRQLLEEYDIETAEDIQDALKDLLGGTIKEMPLHFSREKTKRTCVTHVPNVSEFPLYFFVGLKRLINPLNVEDVKVPVSSNLNPLFIQMP